VLRTSTGKKNPPFRSSSQDSPMLLRFCCDFITRMCEYARTCVAIDQPDTTTRLIAMAVLQSSCSGIVRSARGLPRGLEGEFKVFTWCLGWRVSRVLMVPPFSNGDSEHQISFGIHQTLFAHASHVRLNGVGFRLQYNVHQQLLRFQMSKIPRRGESLPYPPALRQALLASSL
jgi:hypothetical protein